MINLGNFGFRQVERPGIAQRVEQPSAGAAIASLGTVLGAVSEKMQEDKDALNKARGATFWTEARVKANEIQAGLVEEVRAGNVKVDDMLTEFRTRSSNWISTRLEKEPDDFKTLVEGPANNFFDSEQVTVFNQATGLRQSSFSAELVKSSELSKQAALTDPFAASDDLKQTYAAIGPKTGWPEEKLAAQLIADTESIFVENRINWAGQNTSIQELKAEEARMGDASYMPGLGNSRDRVRDYIQTRIREVKGDKDAISRQWEQDVVTQIGIYNDLLSNGDKIPPAVQDDLDKFRRSIAGTKHAKVMDAIVKDNVAVRELATKPLIRQRAMLEEAEADAREATSPKQALELKERKERLTSAYRSNVKQMKENPYAYAARVHGVEFPPLDFSRDLSAQLMQRDRVRSSVQAKTGINPGLLTVEEATQLGELMDSLPAEKQTQMFKGLATADKQTQGVTLGTLGKVDPLKMHAGVHALSGHTASVNGKSGRNLSTMLLEGDKIIKGKMINITEKSRARIRDEVAAYAGPAYAHDPEAFAGIEPMVTAFLAFKTKDGGSLELDVKQRDEAIRNAVDIVTGGIVDFNDRKVVMPYGMKSGDFKGKAPVAISNTLLRRGYSAGQINAMSITLHQADDDGLYYMFNGRNGVPDGKGGVLTVRVR